VLRQVFPFEMKQAPDETGVFAGYGAVFGNVDLGRDVIAPGAFSESLTKWAAKGKLPRMFWQHNSRQPIGKWTEMKEDGYGLFCRGRLTKGVQCADEAYLLMLDEALDGLSIGYQTVDDQYDATLNVRKLLKLDLMEVSPVSIGMNPEALISQVKAAERIKTIREFEDFLRDEGGFSHAAAKAIAAGGFKSSEPRDEDGAAETVRQLQKLAEHIRAAAA
jgi:HK97 family phage prohead protease